MKILQRQLAPGRLEARNFNQEEARKRLVDEVAIAYNQVQRNSVFVHGTPVRYFSKLQRGLPCSCTVKQVDPLSAGAMPRLSEESTSGVSFSFDYADQMIGQQGSSVDSLFEDDQTVLEQPPGEDVNSMPQHMVVEGLFDNGIDCGICFRTRIVGAFEEVNSFRQVFTHYHLIDSQGYTRNDERTPSSIYSEDIQDCYAVFEAIVPKYYSGIEFQVWNNTDLLDTVDLHLEGGGSIAGMHFKAAAGGRVRFQIDGVQEFTHIVLNFRLPVNQLIADFPQDNATMDYNQMKTLSQSTAVIPNTVPRADQDDVIVKLNPNGTPKEAWTVTDTNYFRLEDGYQMGWTLTTRTVQPDESLSKLCKFRTIR